jgi:hypothetical protein
MAESIDTEAIHSAHRDGYRLGLATSALALSAVAFVNMLGIEKSVLSAVLALLALQGAKPIDQLLRRGRAALLVSAVYAVTIVTVLVLYHDKLSDLIHLLQKLS